MIPANDSGQFLWPMILADDSAMLAAQVQVGTGIGGCLTGGKVHIFQGDDIKFHKLAKNACQPGWSPIEERSRPATSTASNRTPRQQQRPSWSTPKVGRQSLRLREFGTARAIGTNQKKLLTGCSKRTIDRPRRRRRTHRSEVKLLTMCSPPTSDKTLVWNLITQGKGKRRSFSW